MGRRNSHPARSARVGQQHGGIVPRRVIVGFRRRAAISSESSLKYFLLGSFATAFFLYGVALMFGATGSTAGPSG